MKIVTSATVWNDAIGKRLSITYAEVDSSTGKVIADNKRMDRVVTDSSVIDAINTLLQHGAEMLES